MGTPETEGCRCELHDSGEQHRRGLHAFKPRKTSRLSKAHKSGRLKFARTSKRKNWSNVVFSDEHKFKQFKGGNPRHNFVWAKFVGEVPGKEMERWGDG